MIPKMREKNYYRTVMPLHAINDGVAPAPSQEIVCADMLAVKVRLEQFMEDEHVGTDSENDGKWGPSLKTIIRKYPWRPPYDKSN